MNRKVSSDGVGLAVMFTESAWKEEILRMFPALWVQAQFWPVLLYANSLENQHIRAGIQTLVR
jgi:hypothetical protein